LDEELRVAHVSEAIRPALEEFARAAAGVPWQRESISALIKELILKYQIKMPQLAIPLRVLTVGQTQTPALDAVLELLGQTTVIDRIQSGLS